MYYRDPKTERVAKVCMFSPSRARQFPMAAVPVAGVDHAVVVDACVTLPTDVAHILAAARQVSL